METIDPADLIDMFLTDNEDTVAQATLYSYNSRSDTSTAGANKTTLRR